MLHLGLSGGIGGVLNNGHKQGKGGCGPGNVGCPDLRKTGGGDIISPNILPVISQKNESDNQTQSEQTEEKSMREWLGPIIVASGLALFFAIGVVIFVSCKKAPQSDDATLEDGEEGTESVASTHYSTSIV